jgi:hypothetical protein
MGAQNLCQTVFLFLIEVPFRGFRGQTDHFDMALCWLPPVGNGEFGMGVGVCVGVKKNIE